MVATRRHPGGDFRDSSPSSTTGTPTTPRSKPNYHYTHHPPPPLIFWLLISLPLVIWDTLYVLLRPHTMPGGQLHSPLWTPYDLYGTVDYVYGWPAWQARDGFTAAQACLNAVETGLYGWYGWVLWSRRRTGRRKERSGRSGDNGGGGGGGLGWFVGWSEKEEEEGGKVTATTAAAAAAAAVTVQGPGVALAVVLAFAAAVMTLSKTILYWLHEYHSGFVNVGHNDTLTLVIYWVIPNGAWLVFPSYMVYVLGKEMVDALDDAKDTSVKRK